MSITDWTGNQWATMFTDEAEKIIGKTSDELGELKEHNTDLYDDYLSKPVFQYHFFKIRAKKEVYNVSHRNKPGCNIYLKYFDGNV